MKTISSNSMTEGVIWKKLVIFSIPLLIGNVFQQLYNAVDSIIVGNYVGSEALAAVGASNPIINLMIGFFMGVSGGAGVAISQYYGADDKEGVHHSVHTTIAICLIGGLFLMFAGIIFTPQILEWMGTPVEVMAGAVLYLRIYFSGSVFVLIYNMGSGILRAVGDSKRPLYYLIIASLINIVLDVFFVVSLGMGIAGVAWATLIAQGFSSLLIILNMMRSKDVYHLVIKDIRIYYQMLRSILRVGIPSGMQQAIISASNLIVQGNINSFGSYAMAGCASYIKIDGFVILPIMSFSMAVTTFTGQNIGAKQFDRVKKGMKTTLILSLSYTLIVSALLYTFGERIISIFSQDAEVLYYGGFMLKCLVPGYIFLAVTHSLAGVIRGAGMAVVPMLIMVANMCGLRLVWLAVMVPIYDNILIVFLGYTITWITTAICMTIYAIKGKWLYRLNML